MRIKIIEYQDLIRHYRELAHGMFVDRASQFAGRLRWDVIVNESDEELDQYDRPGTIYVIATDEFKQHVASMRLRPTALNTMAVEHFGDLWPSHIKDSRVWEVTRFVSNKRARGMVRKLAFSSHAFCLTMGVKALLGVYGSRMERVYRRIGWDPRRIGVREGEGVDICGGYWPVCLTAHEDLRVRADISSGEAISIVETCEAACRRLESQQKGVDQLIFDPFRQAA